MLNLKKKSIWLARGAKYENYNQQIERKETPMPQPAPSTASGAIHGTLPSGFKTTGTIKSSKRQANSTITHQPPKSSGPTHSTLPSGFKSSLQPEVLSSGASKTVGNVGPAYSTFNSNEFSEKGDDTAKKMVSDHLPEEKINVTPTNTVTSQSASDLELRPENYEKVIFTQTFYAIKRLEQVQLRHTKKLESIKHSLEHGYPLSQRDLRYLKRRYEKLKQAIEHQDRIEWTLETIENLLKSNVGDPEKINAIKELLEDEVSLPEDAREYVREAYRLLQRR